MLLDAFGFLPLAPFLLDARRALTAPACPALWQEDAAAVLDLDQALHPQRHQRLAGDMRLRRVPTGTPAS